MLFRLLMENSQMQKKDEELTMASAPLSTEYNSNKIYHKLA